MPGARGALPIGLIGQHAVTHGLPVAESAGKSRHTGQHGGHQHPDPGLVRTTRRRSERESAATRGELAHDPARHQPRDESSREIQDEGLLRRVLQPERQTRQHQPAAFATLRVAPQRRAADRDQQHQQHLHDVVARIKNLHRRHRHQQHRAHRAGAAQRIAHQQRHQQQKKTAHHADRAHLRVRPAFQPAPAGHARPQPRRVMQARAVEVVLVVCKVTRGLKLRRLHRQDRLVRVHGPLLQRGQAVITRHAERDHQQHDERGQGQRSGRLGRHWERGTRPLNEF